MTPHTVQLPAGILDHKCRQPECGRLLAAHLENNINEDLAHDSSQEVQQVKRRLDRWCQVALSASGCMQLGTSGVVEAECLCWNVQVKSGQNQAQWEKAGWITAQDPRGWFQWYCRFFQVGLPTLPGHLPCLGQGCFV